ncbi:MAG: acyl-CoA dehydrogenase family protein [Thermoanaerobaculia bacterium]
MTDLATIRAFLDEQHHGLAGEVTSFAAEPLRRLPPPVDDEAARRQAREILSLLGEAGWSRYAVPAEYGGAAEQIDLRACCLIREALAAASPLADAVFALQCLGSMPLALAGTDELRRRWLPEVAAGRAMAAFAMTEPDAGSDVGSMTTRAVLEGQDYELDGGKTLISNAGIADFYTVFAVTEPAAGARGLTAFVVPADTRGVRLASPQVMSAPHPLGNVAFDAVRVPLDWRLGEEGEGFKIGMQTLDRLRATVAAAACGMAARALEEAVAHARQRQQFGKTLADFQLIQAKLATMATELAAARLLVYRAAWEADNGAERFTLESAMAKAHATEAAQRIVDQAVQIVGGRGVLADHPVDHLYRSVRALRIYEGATEIQQLIIAREMLRT